MTWFLPVLAAQVLTSAIGLWYLWYTRPDEEDWDRGSPRWVILPLAFILVIALTWVLDYLERGTIIR